MELVSAVIITYNRPLEILRRAVVSVLNQTYSPMELIVVNDCPENRELSESIRQMLQELDPGIVYLVHEKNKGACAARNMGLAAAKGTFIGFLDDDDEWLPEKTEKQIALMEENVALVGCDSYRVTQDGIHYHHPTMPCADPVSAILRTNFIGSTSFPLLRTECVRAVGGFDVNVKSCQDYDLWIRLISHYAMAFVGEALAKYYYSEDSTFKQGNQKYIEGSFFLMEKYRQLYESHPEDYLYRLNSGALTGLLVKRDISMYCTFKKAAFRFRPLSRYNFFMLPMKVMGKLNNKIRTRE
ncbi:MAG: glycosyltransferase family 2 protein [Eubacteriales bacterium]|nr:glycosyltransferase family 2 protein [Eubacteriales bacterium]